MTFKPVGSKPKNMKNPFKEFYVDDHSSETPSKARRSKSPKKQGDQIVESLIQQPINAVKFMLGAFPSGETLSYLDYEAISNILRKLGQAAQGSVLVNTFMDQLYIPLLDSISSKPIAHADKVLVAVLQAVPSVQKSLQEDTKSL